MSRFFAWEKRSNPTPSRVHSYHHEIIGDMADLRTMQRDDLYHHYRSYYVPNNALLAIAGDFDTEVHAETD